MIRTTGCWEYDDRRTCQEIVSRVWLGPYIVGKDDDLLSYMHITDIILVRSPVGVERDLLKERSDHYRYHVVEMNDSRIDSPHKIFSSFSDLVAQLSEESGKRVLVLGLTGMNRSCALLAAYLIKYQSLSSDDALAYLASRRRCVSLSEALKRQLSEFEIFAKQFSLTVSPRLKRNRGCFLVFLFGTSS